MFTDLIFFFRFSIRVSKLAHCSPGLFKVSTATGIKIHLYSDNQISRSIYLVRVRNILIQNYFNSSHAVRALGRERQYPLWLLFAAFIDSVGYPRYNPQKKCKQWRTRDRRFHWLWGWFPDLKNNFYDVIRLKIIESQYFPKEMVKVGLEKIKQNGGQLKATKCRWISSAEISNLDVERDFSR